MKKHNIIYDGTVMQPWWIREKTHHSSETTNHFREKTHQYRDAKTPNFHKLSTEFVEISSWWPNIQTLCDGVAQQGFTPKVSCLREPTGAMDQVHAYLEAAKKRKARAEDEPAEPSGSNWGRLGGEVVNIKKLYII